jgi:anti-anti-sigma factor
METQTFETQVAEVPDVPEATAVRIKGVARYPQVPKLRQVILEEIERTSAPRVVIELGQVTKMDTSGAAVLVEALLFGRDRGKTILLCSPSESVLRMFRLAGFEDAIKASCSSPAETRRRLLA